MTTNHRVRATAALILALAAAGAPTASAQAGSPTEGQPSTAVRPNPDEQTVTGANANRTSAAVYSRPDKSLIPLTTPSGHSTRREAIAPQAVVRIQTPQSGFDWGDAGIGAVGGIALSMIGLGGALAVSQNRARRTRRTTALPS